MCYDLPNLPTCKQKALKRFQPSLMPVIMTSITKHTYKILSVVSQSQCNLYRSHGSLVLYRRSWPVLRRGLSLVEPKFQNVPELILTDKTQRRHHTSLQSIRTKRPLATLWQNEHFTTQEEHNTITCRLCPLTALNFVVTSTPRISRHFCFSRRKCLQINSLKVHLRVFNPQPVDEFWKANIF